jgi:hypothetical protein
MSDLRVLTDAELDIVGGGIMTIARPKPTQGCGGGEIRLVEEIIVDILKLLEPNTGLKRAQPA